MENEKLKQQLDSIIIDIEKNGLSDERLASYHMAKKACIDDYEKNRMEVRKTYDEIVERRGDYYGDNWFNKVISEQFTMRFATTEDSMVGRYYKVSDKYHKEWTVYHKVKELCSAYDDNVKIRTVSVTVDNKKDSVTVSDGKYYMVDKTDVLLNEITASEFNEAINKAIDKFNEAIELPF